MRVGRWVEVRDRRWGAENTNGLPACQLGREKKKLYLWHTFPYFHFMGDHTEIVALAMSTAFSFSKDLRSLPTMGQAFSVFIRTQFKQYLLFFAFCVRWWQNWRWGGWLKHDKVLRAVLQLQRGTEETWWKRLHLTKMGELSYSGESVQWSQFRNRQWSERNRRWGKRWNTRRGRQARVRTSSYYAWNGKPPWAWHSGMNKYTDSYVCGQKNNCNRVCGENA